MVGYWDTATRRGKPRDFKSVFDTLAETPATLLLVWLSLLGHALATCTIKPGERSTKCVDPPLNKIEVSVDCDRNGTLQAEITLADDLEYPGVEYSCYNTSSTSGMLEVLPQYSSIEVICNHFGSKKMLLKDLTDLTPMVDTVCIFTGYAQTEMDPDGTCWWLKNIINCSWPAQPSVSSIDFLTSSAAASQSQSMSDVIPSSSISLGFTASAVPDTSPTPQDLSGPFDDLIMQVLLAVATTLTLLILVTITSVLWYLCNWKSNRAKISKDALIQMASSEVIKHKMVSSGEDAKSVVTLYEELGQFGSLTNQGTQQNGFVPHSTSNDSIERESNSSNSQTKCPTEIEEEEEKEEEEEENTKEEGKTKEEEKTKEEHPLDQQPIHLSLNHDIPNKGASPCSPAPEGYIQLDSNGAPYSVGFCSDIDPGFEGGPPNPEAVLANGVADMGQFLPLELKDGNSDYIQPFEFRHPP